MSKRWSTVASWALALLLGALFVLAGSGKFFDFGRNARAFANWGYASWFVIVIGGLETLGGVLVFVPRLASYGAMVIAVVMMGAAYTHASTAIGSPVRRVDHHWLGGDSGAAPLGGSGGCSTPDPGYAARFLPLCRPRQYPVPEPLGAPLPGALRSGLPDAFFWYRRRRWNADDRAVVPTRRLRASVRRRRAEHRLRSTALWF